MSQPRVLSVGNMLVEIMRTGLDQPHWQAGTYAGPFPSGDTVIYIDAVARLGMPAGFVGVVGGSVTADGRVEPDDFARCLLDRFRRDGVDPSGVVVLPGHTTGAAFVAYFTGGTRRFLVHWRHAAAGQLAPEHIQPAYFAAGKWLHLTGCNLAVSEGAREACYRAMACLPPAARVSFDANIRPELLTVSEIRELCAPVIQRADVLLPSVDEAAMLTGEADDEAGCRRWAGEGKLVVLKQGPRGCRIYRRTEICDVPAFEVEEVDPTGAGDAFCAGFTVALLEGMSLPDAGRFANAVGALAVTKLGPMEGVPTREEVNALLAGGRERG